MKLLKFLCIFLIWIISTDLMVHPQVGQRGRTLVRMMIYA
jgi:hypothetical protein